MTRIEKTVFISYRRTNFYTALAVYQDLTLHGYDVFFDFQSIDSGDFEKIITENIKAKAHFLIILSPSALERCNEPGDWLRREIEMAMGEKRNIVPLMMEGFDFGSPSVKDALSGKLATLSRYNGLRLVADYFFEAMEKLRGRYLNVTLENISLHPISPETKETNTAQKASANEASTVERTQLTAEEWFERGYIFVNAKNFDEAIRCFSEAIYLKPDFDEAYLNRGAALGDKGDLDGSIADLDEAIHLNPNFADAYYNRGMARDENGDLDGAIADYSEVIRIKPDYSNAFHNRGLISAIGKGDLDAAILDFNEAIRLNPDDIHAYNNRGLARGKKGDLDGAIKDFNKSVRLKSDDAYTYNNRAVILEIKKNYPSAITDYQKYLELGGGMQEGNQKEIEERIRKLKSKVAKKKSAKKKLK